MESTYADLVQRLTNAGLPVEFYGPQKEESIETLAESLGTALPESLKEFLRCYGGGGVTGDWISGIYGGQPLQPNKGSIYWDTMHCREMYGLPPHLVVISCEDDEIVWCLDTGNPDASGECPVVSYDVFDRAVAATIASSFRAFFQEYVAIRTE